MVYRRLVLHGGHNGHVWMGVSGPSSLTASRGVTLCRGASIVYHGIGTGRRKKNKRHGLHGLHGLQD